MSERPSFREFAAFWWAEQRAAPSKWWWLVLLVTLAVAGIRAEFRVHIESEPAPPNSNP